MPNEKGVIGPTFPRMGKGSSLNRASLNLGSRRGLAFSAVKLASLSGSSRSYSNRSRYASRPKMPHSVSPPASPSVAQEDSIIPDATLHASSDVNTPSSSHGQNGNGAEEALKTNIKLEELFQDGDDDDDEFPSSSAPNGKVESSPPRGPL